jgi:hypothetical protein
MLLLLGGLLICAFFQSLGWDGLWEQVLLEGRNVKASIVLLRVRQHGQHPVCSLQASLHVCLVDQLQGLLSVPHKVQHLQMQEMK